MLCCIIRLVVFILFSFASAVTALAAEPPLSCNMEL